MTVQESTICNLIQGFPVLLILAQNHNRCLKTPFVYKPPSPTPSPEYYEALDALFQSLYGHGYHDDHHGHHDDDHGCHWYETYGKNWNYHTNHYGYKPCNTHSYPAVNPGYPTNGYPTYGYGHHGYGNHGHVQHYPSYGYGLKKVNVYNTSNNHGVHGYKGYAPNQVYNVNHKYKIVVKKTNLGPHRRRSQKLKEESCQTVEGQIGSCVTVYQCEPYLALLKQSRSNPALVQMLRKAHCGFEGNDPKVCCPRPGFATAPPPPPPSTTTTTVAPVEKAAGKSADHADYIAALPEPPVCGFSNATLSRVVGGKNASLGDFPWMALLGYKSQRTGATRWLCGGSLISSKHILTAAHCINGHESDLYLVRLGELDLAREDEGATPVDILIKTQIKHEKYDPNAYTDDIGLLVLERDVEFTDLIRPICIPRAPELRSNNFDRYTPVIAGWGDTQFRGPAATHLQALQLPVVSNDFCKQAYMRYKKQVIDERVLCAGYKKGGRDACQGDSGGPLILPIQNTENYSFSMYQIGVVSFGYKCAEPGFPGIYSRVTHFVPWLEEKVTGTLRDGD